MAIERDMKLLTASDVASLCEVDLKTIHNWVDRGCIPHFRTPGRHLRFQAVDVAGFLREWGYAIPRKFYAQIAHTVLVLGSDEAVAMVTRAAGHSTVIQVVQDLCETAVRVGAEPTTAVVIQDSIAHADLLAFHALVTAVREAFQVPVLVLGEDIHDLTEKAGVLFIPMGDSKMLRAALTGDVDDPAQIEAGILPSPRRKPRRGSF